MLRPLLNKKWTEAWIVQTSGLLSEFSEQLHGFSFTEEQRGEESRIQDHREVTFVIFMYFFTIKLGLNLQCIQGFSTPPWLPLHIHYVWLQLHHFLLQLTHLNLETATRFSLIETHINTLYAHMHREKKSNLPDHSWQQFAPSLSTHPTVCLMLKKCKKTLVIS